MKDSRRAAIEAMPPEVRVARMQGLLRTIVNVNPNNTNTLAAFMNLYSVHSPTVGEDFNGFLEQLDLPDEMFTEHTFDTIVYRYDDIQSGVAPEEATSISFDPK